MQLTIVAHMPTTSRGSSWPRNIASRGRPYMPPTTRRGGLKPDSPPCRRDMPHTNNP